MGSKFTKYKEDLNQLILFGVYLLHSMELSSPAECRSLSSEERAAPKRQLPSFVDDYQSWYSEALVIIKFLLPDRLEDFKRLYEKPRLRKQVTKENYTIEDCLHGLESGFSLGFIDKESAFGPGTAIPKFQQQLNILKATSQRFESSLFDIKLLIQADLFECELDAAKELNKKGFMRGAGAIAGVVLEGHLTQVCENHNLSLPKKNLTINDLNQALFENNIIATPVWRFIQRLGDIRNLCDHKKSSDPSKEDIEELIIGVDKISKTIY